MLVSVIIPVHNGEAFIEQAINSVLAQDYRPIELIVIDNDSTDSTAEIIRRYPEIIYQHQADAGPAGARNTGLSIAQGGYIAFLDADDLWADHHLELLSHHLTQNPTHAFVVGRTQYVYLPGSVQRFTPDGTLIDVATHVTLSSAMFRKEVFDRVGLFASDTSEDTDWYLRAAEQGIQPIVIDNIVLYHRIHADNITNARYQLRSHFFKFIKASLDRRRESNLATNDNLLPWVQIHTT